MENQTIVTSFIFLGFSRDPAIQLLLFLIFLFIYAVTVTGNVVIMVIVKGSSHLNSPMYFFLSHLAILDICFSSITVPNLLVNFYTSHEISFNSCIAQMFFLFVTSSTEIFILAAMAYDRYAAICKPLHYVQIMNRTFCRCLVGGSWAIGFLYAMINTLPVLKLVFCGPNIIQHFSCEFPALLALSCSETFMNRAMYLTAGITVSIYSLSIILVSYIHIICTILKFNSSEAKRKTFSTCSSHLIVVVLYYGSGCFRYMRPSSASSVILDELSSIQYSISTPMLNPIIYSLKTREVKEAIKKLIRYKPLVSHAV